VTDIDTPDATAAKAKRPITHVLLIVDMSGSMVGLADDVRGGFNTYLDGLANADGKYRITATVFDTEFISLCVGAKLKDAPRLTRGNYMPRGATALLDAVGKTVAEFDLRVPDLGEADRVLAVVQTDGQENSSREFTAQAIRELIAAREATGKWTFIYLGAGANAWNNGGAMGFANTVNTAKTRSGTQSTYAGLSRATSMYAAGASGADASSVLNDTAGVTP